MTASDAALGWLCGISIIGLLIVEGIALHLIYTRSEEIFGYFKDSPTLFAKQALMNGGPYGKLILFGDIASTVTFPRSHLKNGRLNPNDLDNIPPSLKRKIKALYWSIIVLLAGGLLGAAIIKLKLIL